MRLARSRSRNRDGDHSSAELAALYEERDRAVQAGSRADGENGVPYSPAGDVYSQQWEQNFDITTRDFQIADAAWGKDMASLKGKTTKRVSPSADIVVSSKIEQRDQVVSIDIMFIDKVAMLIGVATPPGLIIAYSLTDIASKKSSRGVAKVRNGITHFRSVLASQNFRVSTIMSDGEGAVVSLIDELGLLRVEVDISGAGGHVARIERKIRLVKERVRSHVAYHLPFTLSTVGITMCVLYVVSRLNYGNRPEYRNRAPARGRPSSVGSQTARGTSDARSATTSNALCRTQIHHSNRVQST